MSQSCVRLGRRPKRNRGKIATRPRSHFALRYKRLKTSMITRCIQIIAGWICCAACCGAATLIVPPPASTLQPTLDPEPGRVSVPEPSPLAVERYQTGIVVWVVNQSWAIAVPCAFLFTGLSAQVRSWAVARHYDWAIALVLYLLVSCTIDLIVDFPLAYCFGFVRAHRYGLSNQTFGHWLENLFKAFLAGGVGYPPPLRLPGLVPAF